MAKFNFMHATKDGFTTAWQHRDALWRLSITPILIKLGCLAMIFILDAHNNYLRQGLAMMPSHLADGFFISYIIASLHAHQSINVNVAAMRPAYQNIMTGMIIYALTKLILALFSGLSLSYLMPLMQSIDAPDGSAGNAVTDNNMSAGLPDAQVNAQVDDLAATDADTDIATMQQSLLLFTLSFSGIAVMIWGFRYIWMYIPAAMGMNIRQFMTYLRPFALSWSMIACWFACFIPFVIAMIIISNLVLTAMGIDGVGTLPISTVVIISAIQAVIDMAMIIVVSLAMKSGLTAFMKNP